MAKDALIGTGLVGSALLEQREFNFVYNSRNRYEIRGMEFDSVYCAAMPGTMWKANLYPNADRSTLEDLFDSLNSIKCKRFILISTVAVYENGAKKNETECPFPDSHYGRNRLDLEKFVQDRFPNYLIVRLPALVHKNLKKGPLYDLKYNHEVDKLCPNSYYQWYALKYLNRDVNLSLQNKINLINFVTCPISMNSLCNWFKPDLVDKLMGDKPLNYDIRSIYGDIGPFPFNELEEYFNENVL